MRKDKWIEESHQEIKSRLKEIVKKAEKRNVRFVIPTLEERNQIRKIIFDLITEDGANLIRKEIIDVVTEREPRANLIDVLVQPIPDENRYVVKVIFSMINTLTNQFSIKIL